MTGRPLNPDRQNALDLGLMTYVGAIHFRCGTNIRYVKGGGCMHCGRLIATEQREARKYLRAQQQDLLDRPQEESEEEAEARRQAAIDEIM